MLIFESLNALIMVIILFENMKFFSQTKLAIVHYKLFNKASGLATVIAIVEYEWELLKIQWL